MSLKSITLAISLSICVLAIGQYDLEKATKDSVSTIKRDRYISALKQNIYVGSGFNLLLGNQLSVYASPQIGYEFLPNFSAGFLGLMHYYQDPFYRQSAFGGGVFTRYIFLKRGIFETSFNLYKINANFTGQLNPFEYNAKSWMVGLGYARPIGDRSYINILISYDLLGDPYNPESLILDLNNFRLYYKFGIMLYPFN